ncbi:ABC transporter permease [Siminovitchia sp. FSL H7-0308]|uniref:ABC-type dipeptide/oligopeptide/nickel transport system permease component n=1 Tax=Siminovitchia thermophila TaxID=1245522 RepID=A0ABS2R7Z8_9BACI|nr:ABC transporter permease [Siminovitchia thermophila]MBM7715776.1 ABC-type dipeptide/oligopeptide/nickel transport system permease component [Siminovitchia thermophila]ONK23565.1 glutathione ABC transporter permease GsiC [Bacillus sp. VT-16-64]
MVNYIVRKTFLMIPALFGLTIIVFMILHLSPGDPVDLIAGPNAPAEVHENIKKDLGLDQPLHVQYFTFIGHLFKGDLGVSILQNRPVADIIGERLLVTFEIGIYALIFSFVVSIPIGVVAAIKRNTLADYASMTGALIGLSLPTFLFGLLLLYFFAYKLGWFPLSGYGTYKHLVLPVLTVGLTDAAITARMVRSSMLEVIRQDYIRTARAKGLEEKSVIFKHALKNAIIPIITLFGMRLGLIFGGSVIIETVFSIPGIGKLMVDAIFSRDYPIVQGSMLILAALVLIGNLITDILYAVFDPRIKY